MQILRSKDLYLYSTKINLPSSIESALQFAGASAVAYPGSGAKVRPEVRFKCVSKVCTKKDSKTFSIRDIGTSRCALKGLIRAQLGDDAEDHFDTVGVP